MRSLVSFFGGAVACALVVGALAVAGVIDDDPAPVIQQAPPSPPAQGSAGDSPSSKAGETVADIYKRVASGVVFVQAGQTGTGSGFVYDDQGHIVTNEHVVDNASQFMVRIGKDTKPVRARLVGKDGSSDLAVLQVDPKDVKGGLKPLELGDSDALEPGDQTIAIGSPFGLEGTVTTGIVSSLGRTIEAPNGFPIADAIQTDAAINPGNSGGPLLDGNGRVIGVNSQIRSGSGSNSGVGFAVPVSTVKFVVPQIQNGGKVERAYLGIENGDTPDLSGAVIGNVIPGGPAAQAGLQRGDKITAIDGEPITGSEDVSAAVAARKPGEKAKVTVIRQGDRRTLEVDLGTRPETAGG